MKYFNTLPLIAQTDYNNNYIAVSNLLTRSYLLPSLKNNLMLFYEYNISEFDTPENIAYKYYKDLDRYWILLYSNNIMHPLHDWPKTNQQFLLYVNDKYTAATAEALSIPVQDVTQSQILAYISSTVHHYEQSITIYDNVNLQKQTITVEIDENTYNNLIESDTTKTFTDTNVSVTREIRKNVVSIYEYEFNLNESKRKINLMKDTFVTATEQQFRNLMSQ